MTTLVLSAVSVPSIWWWVVGLAIIALPLIALGRRAGRANIAGQVPPDQGPDLMGAEQRLTPDVRPDDQKISK